MAIHPSSRRASQFDQEKGQFCCAEQGRATLQNGDVFDYRLIRAAPTCGVFLSFLCDSSDCKLFLRLRQAVLRTLKQLFACLLSRVPSIRRRQVHWHVRDVAVLRSTLNS